MKKMIVLAIACNIMLCISNFSIAQDKIDPPDVSADVTGIDDPLETSVIVRVGSIGLNLKGGAHFFRGFIDKANGALTYQLYIQTKSSGLMYWNEAKYLSEKGLKQLPASVTSAETRCSNWGCLGLEDVVVNIDRDTLIDWGKKDTVVRLVSQSSTGTKDIDVGDGDAKDFLESMDKISNFMKIQRKP